MSNRKTFKCAIFLFSSFNIGSVLVYFVVFLQCQTWIFAQDFMCCSHATGSCRSVCEKIPLVKLAANNRLRKDTISELQSFCPTQLNSFWECLNTTFKDISRGESWSGRVCCPLPHSDSCRRACITATSIFDLGVGCRQSDEIAFFSCLDKQREGDLCCRNTASDDCKEACLNVFRSQLTPTKMHRQRVKEYCENTSPKVIECVKDFVKVTPATNLQNHMHCCDMSNNSKCRDTCEKVLTSKQKQTSIQEVIDALQLGGCGMPLPQEFFWQCFLKPSNELVSTSVEISRIDRVGMDSAKWHCCQRAATSQCQSLCSRTFTKFWATSWEDFQYKCLNHISEESLRSCIEEVDEPCELGCDGLSFCTNFNNRPTDLFRSCTPQADEAALSDVQLWQSQNELTLPGLTLPLKNISVCSPNIWKAVACTLQVKPCSRRSHATQICRDVCLNILSQCVDWSHVKVGHTAQSICDSLSPDDPDVSCIDLENFLNPSENNYQRVTEQVSSPCKGDPCEANEICLVDRTCLPGNNCKSYKCMSGCKLGEVSDYMVPEGTNVRIPIPKNPKGCLQICKCAKNKIEDCQPLPCVTLTSCLLGNMQQLHGTFFNIECNSCSCFAGEVICSKKQCESTSLGGKNIAYTTLPCNCPPHYSPVCGRNGNIYPSSCLAKCAGLTDSDIEYMPCQDPCKSNRCPIGQKCVPNPQICLSLMHRNCTQYECINGSTKCDKAPYDPVCDTENKEYPNSCLLAHKGEKLAYRGPCLMNCKYRGHVCGINGRTYISECAAIADMVTIDYPGPCMTVGLITNKKQQQCPYYIKCPILPKEDCLGITPPGACCPVCGGALKLLYSRKQIDRALYALQGRSTSSLTLRALLKALERQILVAQCVLRGFLSVELDIFVLVQTSEKDPSELQLEACVREAEKLASLVNMQSPRIASELALSSLTAATIVHTQLTSAALTVFCNFYYAILFPLFAVKLNQILFS